MLVHASNTAQFYLYCMQGPACSVHPPLTSSGCRGERMTPGGKPRASTCARGWGAEEVAQHWRAMHTSGGRRQASNQPPTRIATSFPLPTPQLAMPIPPPTRLSKPPQPLGKPPTSSGARRSRPLPPPRPSCLTRSLSSGHCSSTWREHTSPCDQLVSCVRVVRIRRGSVGASVRKARWRSGMPGGSEGAPRAPCAACPARATPSGATCPGSGQSPRRRPAGLRLGLLGFRWDEARV